MVVKHGILTEQGPDVAGLGRGHELESVRRNFQGGLCRVKRLK